METAPRFINFHVCWLGQFCYNAEKEKNGTLLKELGILDVTSRRIQTTKQRLRSSKKDQDIYRVV